MKPQLAYDAIALEYGDTTVCLRPSLRAAIYLERLHGGFPKLLRKIEEFDTTTIRQVITASAGTDAAEALFAHLAPLPLADFHAASQRPCFELVAAFFPEHPKADAKQANTANRTPWRELFQELYGFATGWLHWTPDTAWNATPQEITDAYAAHVSMLKAIHGDAEETESRQTREQRKQNVELGLDPDFDRAGLAELGALSANREGQII